MGNWNIMIQCHQFGRIYNGLKQSTVRLLDSHIKRLGNPSIQPTQCCIIQIKVPDTSHYDSHSYQFVDSSFSGITAGDTDDPLFRMTSYSDYAPVMITYEDYPDPQVGNCECNITFKRSRFISTHGSHTGAIDIRGRIQTVRLERMIFSKTVAEDGVIFTPDAVYGNVMYANSADDISHMTSEFIKLCRSDSDAPKLAAQSNLDIGSLDYLIPDFYNSVVVSESGSDSTGIGTEQNPFLTVYTAVALMNPKKASFVERIVDMEDIIITIDLKAGTYIEPIIRIISERMTMKGEGIQNSIIKNDITSEEKTSCLLSIEPDNTECKLDINDIAFEQQNYGSINDDALIMIQYGEVRLQSCSFRQTDSSTQHNTPYIRIKQKQVALSGISFLNGNFSYNTAAVEVIPGGGAILNGCNFANIIGAASISAVISEIQSDLIMYNCKFLNCQSYSGSIPSGSTVSISSTFQQDFSNNIVQSILKSPVCTFTQCQFTGNTGQMNSEIQFLGQPMIIGFVQCNINSNNISFSSQWVNSYLDEVKSYSFGGCTGSASNETIYVNSTGASIHSITQAISQKTQGGQSLLTLQIGSGTWEDDGLMIGARSISLQGAGVNDTLLMNKITSKIWLACVIGGKLNITKIGLRQASTSGSYGGMLVLRGEGAIELKQLVIRQREQSLKQSSSSIYATAGDIIITDSIFERAQFINRLSPPQYAASIYCEDKFGLLSITNSSFTLSNTSLADPPTEEQIRQQELIEYGGGCIVIQNAQSLKLLNCNFTLNQGWRTGVLNVQKMRNNWKFQQTGINASQTYFSITNCNFNDNDALKDSIIQSTSLKRNIGRDIILDHIYIKNEIVFSIQQCSSSSPVPKIGSVYNQFQKGVLDSILFSRKTASTAYVSNRGINLITSTSGSIDDPLKTIQFSLFHTMSSQTQAAHIFLFPGTFAEQSLFVGGHSLYITGTSEGQIEPNSTLTTANLPGPSQIQNTKETNQDLIQVYDGIITLQILIIQLDNRDDKYIPFGAIAIHGKQSSATIDYCSFNVIDPRIYLDKEFISIDRGGNLTMRHSSVHNILIKTKPILYSGFREIKFTNATVTFAFTGKKPFGGALLIHLCESPFSTSYFYESGGQQLNNSRKLTIRDCSFDSNIGDCGGAIAVSGTRSLLSEEKIQIINCFFESNIAGSDFEWAGEPCGNDVYFYFANASSIIYNETNQDLIQ
ncbi:MAG: hypothetical protein EZS28_018737, partial [Streblomastix strix]